MLRSVAMISRANKRKALVVAGVALCGVLSGPGRDPARDQKPPRITAIALEPSGDKVSLLPGEQQAIRATATYSDKSTEDVTGRLVYSSSKPEVVEIVGLGLARAIKGGDAEVKAYDPVSRKDARTSVKIKVAKLKRIDLVPEVKVIPLGRALELHAIATCDNGRSGIDVSDRVTWSSDKSSIAAVEAGPDGAMLGRGVSAGKTKILAFEPLDRVKSDSNSGKVTVVAKLAAVVVDPESVALRNGRTVALIASGVYESDTIADLTPYVEWISSHESIASVAPGGLLTARGIGSATIAAHEPESGITSAGEDSAAIDVVGALIGLAVSPATLTLPIGGTGRLTALAAFEGRDEPVQIEQDVLWKSSNTASVAIESATGVVRCAAGGAATISFTEAESSSGSTAYAGDARVACVSDVPIVQVAPAKKLLAVGKSATLTALLIKPDGKERDITTRVVWTSSRRDVVSVARSGDLVRGRGVAPGTAVITANDPVSGTTSDGPGGTSSNLSVPGPAKVLKIFPSPSDSGAIELTTGTPFLLKARVDFEGGANQGANAIVLWTSSNTSVLQVSNGDDGKQAGLAKPLRSGDVTVTMQYPKPGAPPPQFPPAQPMSKSVKVRVR